MIFMILKRIRAMSWLSQVELLGVLLVNATRWFGAPSPWTGSRHFKELAKEICDHNVIPAARKETQGKPLITSKKFRKFPTK